MTGRHIVIVGGGLVGQTLAEKLSRDGYDVALIERDPAKVRELADTLDVQVIEGSGSVAAVLRAAGAERASLVVASTDSDDCNVVVGLLAAEYFHVPRVVVRVRDARHEEALSLISRAEYALVNPDVAAVDSIATLLSVPGAIDVSTFMGGELMVAGFRIKLESDFAGLHVSDTQLLFAGTATLAVAIHRGRDWIVPTAFDEFRVGDLVYYAIAREHIMDVCSLVGTAEEARGRIMVAGATSVGLMLARRLREDEFHVVLLEEDREAAVRASESLEDVLVIHGKATDQGLLEDEEIEQVSTFVAVTDDHETNLVAGLLAKRLGAARAFALVDNPALVGLLGDIELDAIISQRLLTIGLTMQHVRGAGVRSGAALLEDQIEILEVEAVDGCRLTAGKLMEVKLPPGVLVAAIRRGDTMLVPRGSDAVRGGDHVLLITTADRAEELTRFLKP